MYVPLAAAVVVQKYIYREPVREAIGLSFKINRWFLAAWLFPVAAALAAFGVGLILPGVAYSPEMSGMFQRFQSALTPEQLERMRAQIAALPVHPFWLGLGQALVAAVTINAVAAFGEEAGWRGFLQRELAGLGFWKSSFAVGFIWGVWHAPIIIQGHNYPEHPRLGVLFMILFCLFYTPILIFVRIRARSVIAAAVMHGSINASWGLSVMLLSGGSDLIVGVAGIAGLAVLALVDLVLFLSRRAPADDPLPVLESG
jgi:membrane protease YdiL (CAAX protease family)